MSTKIAPPEPTMSRHQRRSAQIRLDFLNAAAELIMERGYDDVTVTEIAQRADYGRSTFYLHFQDKEDLVWQMLQHHMYLLDQRIRASVAQMESPLREWRAWQIIFAEIDQKRAFFLRLDGEMSRRLRQQQKDFLILGFEQQLREGHFSLLLDVPPDLGSRFVVGALLEMLDYWLDHPERGSAKEMAGYLFQMVFRQSPPE